MAGMWPPDGSPTLMCENPLESPSTTIVSNSPGCSSASAVMSTSTDKSPKGTGYCSGGAERERASSPRADVPTAAARWVNKNKCHSTKDVMMDMEFALGVNEAEPDRKSLDHSMSCSVSVSISALMWVSLSRSRYCGCGCGRGCGSYGALWEPSASVVDLSLTLVSIAEA